MSSYDLGRTQAVNVEVEQERWWQECEIRSGKIPWDCADPTVDDDAKLAVLGEEFGEVCRALVENDGNLRVELIQVAAVAVAWAEALAADAE
jgi:NTP pyrophosphatase (non-canonical NTP hydrolase)